MCHCARSAVFIFCFLALLLTGRRKNSGLDFICLLLLFKRGGGKRRKRKAGRKKRKKEQNICAVSCFCAPCDSVKMKKI